MAEDLDILDEGTDALAMVTIMRNEILSKRPDHFFVEYLDTIELSIRKMRERNLKGMAELIQLRDSFANMRDIDKEFEEYIEEETKAFNENESNRNLALGQRQLPNGDRDTPF